MKTLEQYNEEIQNLKKRFNKVVDNADNNGILIASQHKMPTDPNAKKSSDWLLTSDVLRDMIGLFSLTNTTNLEVCHEEVFFCC